jgi:hypothetical protein
MRIMKTHSLTKTLMTILAVLTLQPAAWCQDSVFQQQVAGDYGTLLSQPGGSARFRNVRDPSTPYGSKDSAPPVVVEFSRGRLNSVEMMEEDLAVMTRIVEKALDGELGDEQAPVKAGIPMTLTTSGRSVRAMYVEGLGPLFMIKVNFPLLAPRAVEVKQPEAKASTEWEKARKELKGSGDEDEWRGTGAANTFSEETVTALKKALLDALKQAANIRQLKPEDFIAMSVFGGDGAGTDRWSGGTRGGNAPGTLRSSAKFPRNLPAAGGNPNADSALNQQLIPNEHQPASPLVPASPRPGEIATVANPSRMASPVQTSRRVASSVSPEYALGPGRGTVLTVRVKKVDVDALAKGELTPEAFAKQATFHAYEDSGHGLASLNSWLQRAYPVRN